jgi:signal peptidase II
MYLHEEINVIGDWFRLHYLLNPGMAFGIRWENEFGKLALTVFRIGAMFGIAYFLLKMARKSTHAGFLWCMALILGGAVGNVIDSTFYGVLLDNHPSDSPTPWFHGQVIDMLFFPLFEFYWPDWLPYVGGEYFMFFSPVFNIADSSIFVGVVMILLFQRRFFTDKLHHEETHVVTPEDQPTSLNGVPHTHIPSGETLPPTTDTTPVPGTEDTPQEPK